MSNHQSTIVVKLGGTEGVDFSAICLDVVGLLEQGHKIVLVHGGSAEANRAPGPKRPAAPIDRTPAENARLLRLPKFVLVMSSSFRGSVEQAAEHRPSAIGASRECRTGNSGRQIGTKAWRSGLSFVIRR